MKYLEIGALFGLMVFSLYRSRCIDNDPEAWESGKGATSWIIPYSIMSVLTGIIADVMENHWGATTFLEEAMGQSDIVSWELIYFIAGVPLALVAEKVATYLYNRFGKKETPVNFEVSSYQNVRSRIRAIPKTVKARIARRGRLAVKA
jgi:hypothetical protein